MENLDNQPNQPAPELETKKENQLENSALKESESRALDFSRLTHQNWLFINAFLSTGSVKKAYQLAKYSGTDESAPYQIFKKLKVYIEQIGDLDVTSRARLQADVKGLLEIPLLESQKLGVTLKEKIEILKLAAKLTPEAIQARPQISMLVINRPSSKPEPIDLNKEGTTQNGGEVNSSTSDSPKIIDADIIEPNA